MSFTLPMSLTGNDRKEKIEEKIVFGRTDQVEFSIYNTNVKTSGVVFKATNPLYCGMILGRKVVNTKGYIPFDFSCGESMVIPADGEMSIDFPDASLDIPTRCLKVEIDQDKLGEIIENLNETFEKAHQQDELKYDSGKHLHFTNNNHISKILGDMFEISLEENLFRPALMELKVLELTIRVLQMQSVARLLKNSSNLATVHPLSHVAEYIKTHLGDPISVDELARKAHMSTAQLFRYFKNYFGMTPVQYTNELRIERAKQLLKDPNTSVTEVCYQIGLNSLSYFIQLFKNKIGSTPKQYQNRFKPERRKSTNTSVMSG
jgi:AraC-like DNA-binding protein